MNACIDELNTLLANLRAQQENLAQGNLMPSQSTILADKRLPEALINPSRHERTDNYTPFVLRRALRARFCGYLKMLGQFAHEANDLTTQTFHQLYAKYAFLKSREWQAISREAISRDIKTIAQALRQLATTYAFGDVQTTPNLPTIPHITLCDETDNPLLEDCARADEITQWNRSTAWNEYFLNYPELDPLREGAVLNSDEVKCPYCEMAAALRRFANEIAAHSPACASRTLDLARLRAMLKAPSKFFYTAYLYPKVPEGSEGVKDFCNWVTETREEELWGDDDRAAFEQALSAFIDAGFTATRKIADAFVAWREAKKAYAKSVLRFTNDDDASCCVRELFLLALGKAVDALPDEWPAKKSAKKPGRKRTREKEKQLQRAKKYILAHRKEDSKAKNFITAVVQHVLCTDKTGKLRKVGKGAYVGQPLKKDPQQYRSQALYMAIKRMLNEPNLVTKPKRSL